MIDRLLCVRKSGEGQQGSLEFIHHCVANYNPDCRRRLLKSIDFHHPKLKVIVVDDSLEARTNRDLVPLTPKTFVSNLTHCRRWRRASRNSRVGWNSSQPLSTLASRRAATWD